MNLHASLIVDLAQYNVVWLMNVLKNKTFDIRSIKSKKVDRYVYEQDEIDKLFLWTKDTYQISKKLNKIEEMGYDYHVINELALYESFYEPLRKPKNSTINHFIKNSAKYNMSFCYGPVFLNKYITMDWHKGQLRFLWSLMGKNSRDLYLNFNINKSLQGSRKYYAKELTEGQKSELIEFAKDLVGEDVAVKIKPSYYELSKSNDIDLGIENFCFSRSVFNQGMNDLNVQSALATLHDPKSSSLILNERADETIINKSLKRNNSGYIQNNDKNNNKKLLVEDNSNNLFNFL